jgi:MazG family protein
MTTRDEFVRLCDVIHKLRAQCPWDRKQTHESLRPYLLEEAYEVLHALDAGDRGELREELGDLMLQIVLHAEIAAESGQFDIADVMRTITEKLIRRHPHVFKDVQVDGAEQVLDNWEQIKRAEKGDGRRSALAGVPESLPALLKAVRMLSKMRHSGVDPLAGRCALTDARQRIDALLHGDGDAAAVERDVGLLALATAEAGVRIGVNAEDALRGVLHRLGEAFQREEHAAAERGRTLDDLSEEESAAVIARLLVACEGAT